ncbi:MAG: S9 family peptidase, partial [Candidatus Dormibacteraeota bacterium]|nr:S9 family peptidase [Candidatus Dormibacteraeota bacterium]
MSETETDLDAVVETLHGVRVSDPFRWLEDATSARARAWTEDQDHRARALLGSLPGRERLRRRLDEALGGGSLGRSVPRGGRRFFTRREPGRDQPAIWVAEVGT